MINPSTVTPKQHSEDEEMQMTSHSMENFNTLSHSEEDQDFNDDSVHTLK